MRTCLASLVLLTACPGARPVPTVPAADRVAIPLTAATAIATPSSITRADISPPCSLTASDGSGLALVRVDAKAVVEGPLAFTELHLYFRNDEDRRREGTFQITLPEHAAVSRFAMENAGAWMEAEVVPKLVARRAYEDFLHRRQDPALLEKAAGNQFTARVFPIAPRALKHLVISYSQERAGYVLPLRGLPRTERVDVELAVAGADGNRTTQRLSERAWLPDRDFAATASTAAAVSAGGLVVAQVEIGGTATRDTPRGITLLVDTSASRALGYEAYIASVKRLVDDLRATWGDALPLGVVAFDQDTELVFDGRAADFGAAEVTKLVERGAAGASDVGQALAWLASRPIQPRVVVVGDGVITAGLEGGALQAAVKKLPQVERIDVALVGGLRDARTAGQLVRAGLLHAGAVLDLATDRVALALGESVATNVAVDVPGASWVFPRTIPAARAGTPVMVFAKLARPAASFDVIVGGARRTLRAVPGTPPLVERAIAGAELAELELQASAATGETATALRSAIAKKSVASRVLSSETSLLVLESDGDYARYGLARTALVDVLVVGERGVERLHRSDVSPIPAHGPAPEVTAAPTDRLPPPARAEPPAAKSTPDNDRDGILDVADRCPNEPEAYNGFDDDDGCPDRGRVVVTSTALMVLDEVRFRSRSAVIDSNSLPILDVIARTLSENPGIELVEIQGHTDERGDDATNLDLSEHRAESVKHYLVTRGIAENRLVARGYGETLPIDRRHDERAWAANRRVAFLILRRGDADAVTEIRTTPPAPPPPPPPPVTGELAEIEDAVAARRLDDALARARDWHAREPGNVLALIGLGEVLEATHADATAARVYGSIIDLFPGRGDMRRFAGERLARLPGAKDLVIDTFRRAVADRPDHLTGHRLLAYALVRADRPADAFAAILAGLDDTTHRTDGYRGAPRVLADDAAMIGAVYARAVPAQRSAIAKQLAQRKLTIATAPSTRFVLYWETDNNDVDLHITDAAGAHAFYSAPKLASGGELYADVTAGYGPECFAIAGTPTGGPYRLALDYYAQGPMGYGMGLLEIQRFDPDRGLVFEDRPYVIMNDHAKVDLGTYRPR